MQITNNEPGTELPRIIAEQAAMGTRADCRSTVGKSWRLFRWPAPMLAAPLRFLKGQMFVIYMYALELLYTLYK
ncbi:hypothetical protein HYN43_008675 [Mucilaginibacter celer]|uniref:Uncharacterized protein n=1 Tax=Mucilaginibacter celer TaxID=2305508 RepID=A0A494VVA0_9SPHI|nr:hypothetical protein HYN43_008675 [Mucilaginibacter celer]